MTDWLNSYVLYRQSGNQTIQKKFSFIFISAFNMWERSKVQRAFFMYIAVSFQLLHNLNNLVYNCRTIAVRCFGTISNWNFKAWAWNIVLWVFSECLWTVDITITLRHLKLIRVLDRIIFQAHAQASSLFIYELWTIFVYI